MLTGNQLPRNTARASAMSLRCRTTMASLLAFGLRATASRLRKQCSSASVETKSALLARRRPSSRTRAFVSDKRLSVAWISLLLLGLTGLDATKLLAADPPVGEVRDVILMLPNGPLHVRLHVSVGKLAPTDARKAAVARILKSLDTNGDGKLQRDEAQRSPLFREKQRAGAEEFVKSIGADLTVSPRDIERRMEQVGGETVVYRQNPSTSETDDEVFKSLDVNGDMVISEYEMYDAVDKLLVKDADDDECVTLDELLPPDPAAAAMVPQATPQDPPKAAVSSISDIIRDTQQTLLPALMVQKYDQNKNTKLSASELNWTRQKLATCDLDNDGELNTKELAQLKKSPVDIELSVDVIRTTGESMLRVINTTGKRTDEDRYADLATFSMTDVILTFSAREVDPYEASMSNALRIFNELDTDANGYLSREEAMIRERFGRGLFDQIDADGDGKIFGDEMKDFIRIRGEPVATTCQITVFDDGAGFFSALDSNGDRRLSVRELRYADKTLSKMERDGKPGLSGTEPIRRYRVEFARGVFNPFSNPDRVVNVRMPQQTVLPIPRTSGPIWFQRWDRNSDGDLTWREFLGPRDAFEQLDADGDDLIDVKEAAAAIDLIRDRTPKPGLPTLPKQKPADVPRSELIRSQ